jgi:hypothetical protein
MKQLVRLRERHSIGCPTLAKLAAGLLLFAPDKFAVCDPRECSVAVTYSCKPGQDSL